MVEKISRSKDTNIETVGEREEEKARTHLQSFLGENYKLIRAMRSYRNFIKGYNIDSEQLEKLENFIKQGNLHWFYYSLCEISDFGELYEHDNSSFSNATLSFLRLQPCQPQAVRGFHFGFQLEGNNFECVDLDGGGSRNYFDQKDADNKRKFIKRFTDRRRSSTIYMGDPKKLPLGFTAFITDDGEKFVIEDIVSYQDRTPPSRRK